MENNRPDSQSIIIGWKAVAAALGVSVSTARNYARRHGLPVYRFGGSVRIDRYDLERWYCDKKEVFNLRKNG